MSAIAGLLRLDQTEVKVPDLQQMVSALSVHGPDRQKIWSHQELGLAHCLMRFTPEDYFEQQPITDKENGIAMVFAGRIDNRNELAQQLQLPSTQVKLISDSQLAQLAYASWEKKAFTRIIGDWVWAIWLRQTRQLLLIRDPQGYHRSLHYTLQNNFFAFSTAPKGLMALADMPRAMDQGALADFLILNHKALSNTLYKGVQRLEAGHVLTLDAASGNISIERYWQIDVTKRIIYRHDQDYVEHFNELFDQSVRARLRSCHPVGAFMSGGIDSSAVATTAAKQLALEGKSLSTYTAVPQAGFNDSAPWGRYNDETPLVNAVAKMSPNMKTHFITSEGMDQFTGLENHLEQGEAPFRNPANRVWMENIMQTAAAKGERVLLTGQLGNFTISYDGSWSLANWLKSLNLIKLFWGIKQLNGYRERDLAYITKNLLAKPLLPAWLYRNLVACYAKRPFFWTSNSLIKPAFAEQMQVASRATEAGFDPYWQGFSCSRAMRKQLLSGNNYSSDMHEGWRAAFGVDLRDPTGDRRIIEYCLAIPDEQYLNRKGLRWLANRTFADRLPTAVLNNPLRGAQDPGWHLRMQQSKAEFELEYQRLVQNSTAQQVLDLPRMRKLLDEWPTEGTNWNSKKIIGPYRLALARGIMVGRYIRWFEGDNH